MEDEIDLRAYLEILLKRWYWLIGISLLGAIVAFAVSSILPPLYEAAATVLILQARTNISFEPTIQEDQGGTRAGSTVRDEQLTLVNLVKSSEVASRVLQELGDILPPASQNISDLIAKTETTNQANLIIIKITDQNPQVAAQLADRWARVYENYINQLYNGHSFVLLGEVEQQAAEAGTNYQKAQANLEAFLRNNQIAVLTLDIQNLDNNLATKYSLLVQQFDLQHNILADEYGELRRLEGWLENAKTIQDQLDRSNRTSTNGFDALITLILLQNQISVSNSPLSLEMNLANLADSPISPDDAANLIEVIEARKARVEANIETQEAELLALPENSEAVQQLLTGSESAESIAPLIAEKLALEGQLAAAEAQKRELEAIRDLAWQNHQAMQRKLAEVQLDLQFTNSEVRVASFAIVPDNPVAPRRLFNTLLGGLLGFILTVFGIFAIEYWHQEESGAEQIQSVPNKPIAPTS